MTIKELMNDAIQYNEVTLSNIIMVLVVKKALTWDDDVEKLQGFLKPRYNARFKEVMTELGLI